MNKKKINIFLISTLVLVVAFILILNYRTPFLRKEGSGWSIGYGYSESIDSINTLVNINIYSKNKLRKLDSLSSFIADPFFIKEKDTFYIFFENQKTNSNAEIGLLVSDNGVDYKYKGTVLNEEFHLSYPQVFKYKSEYYMLPETKQSGNILLYRANNFPYKWKIIDTLVTNVYLKDPSIYISDSLNFLICSDDDMRLYMYISDSLRGDWVLNKKKPLITRGTEARAAGRIININNQILVPIQNSSNGYGYGVSLYNIKFDENFNYTFTKNNHLFLKANDNFLEFEGGMHHIDIQKFNRKFYYVTDGYSLSSKKYVNFKGPLKWNFLDFLNWFEQHFK